MARNSDVRRRARRQNNAFTNLVFGLAVLAVGAIFWMDHQGRIEGMQYLRWWPAAVVAFALAHALQRQWAGALIWGAVGGFFLLPLLGYQLTFSVWRLIGLWPLVYCAAGVALVMQALRTHDGRGGFHAVAVMAGNVRRLGRRDFDGGDVIALMGGCEIDLSAAALPREAIIDVMAFWGGIGIRIPQGWNVVDRTVAILGTVDDQTDEAPETAPRLVVRGTVIMGGVELRHTPGE